MNLVLIAYLLEAAFSYPGFLYATIRHPVVWMGGLIDFLDKNCNNPHAGSYYGKICGVLAMLTLITLTLAVSLLITRYGGDLLQVIAMATLFATRNLHDHVRAVYTPLKAGNLHNHMDGVYAPLKAGDLAQARNGLAKIVGRDVEKLDESGINRASIESLAESFCDGVVAPVFYAACFGLPGIACYKAINTADSMIGHKTPRHINFGWAAARLDDAANFIPSRLSALLIAVSSISRAVYALRTTWRDARKHASPNSGYPEAAMAGALGVCLGGSRSYGGEEYSAPLIGEELRKTVTTQDLQKAMRIYIISCLIIWIILLALAIAL